MWLFYFLNLHYLENPKKYIIIYSAHNTFKGAKMELKNSQTLINLARSFAGESQAGLRYQMIVDMCIMQGYKVLGDEVKLIAKNEVNHAKTFFKLITDKLEDVNNITIEAGYPFEGTSLLDALKFSMEQEKEEAENIYPKFAIIAKEEGFPDIAEKFLLVSKVEKQHELKFKYLYESMKNDTLYKTKQPAMWECTECGHIETSESAWTVCPLCNSSQGFVKLQLP